jgi:Zn finger protein HypA/HybF involved in hydrogenase expression
MLNEVLKLLNADKLDESQQGLLKEKLDSIIDVKARERADSLLGEDRTKLIKEYEEKFEEYKKDITSKFSNFVDSVLDEELKIPDKVLQYARKGELYEEVIEAFKVKLAIDEGALTEEVKKLLKEAKDEIVDLRGQVNGLTATNMELAEDAKELSAHIYLRKKCDGLTESQKTKVLNLLGDITNKEEIDRKFKVVVEEADPGEADKGVPAGTEEPDAEAITNANKCPQCGAVATPKGGETIVNCPKCGAKMEDVTAVDKAPEMGQGHMELTDPPESSGKAQIGESESLLDDDKKTWLKILRENKF